MQAAQPVQQQPNPPVLSHSQAPQPFEGSLRYHVYLVPNQAGQVTPVGMTEQCHIVQGLAQQNIAAPLSQTQLGSRLMNTAPPPQISEVQWTPINNNQEVYVKFGNPPAPIHIQPGQNVVLQVFFQNLGQPQNVESLGNQLIITP